MTRERRNPPEEASGRRSRPDAADSPGERVRRRLSAAPEVELTDEELRALADEGIDPDDVRRLAIERRDADEASPHDRDTARDEIEGLAHEAEQDY
jgi:hypothetical protein